MAAAGAWTPTATTRTQILNGSFDWDTTLFKVALFTSASNLTTASTSYAAVTSEVANANGYTTGGITVTFVISGTTTVSVAFNQNPAWAASGGSLVARWAAIYAVGGNIAFFCLLDGTPADVTVTANNVLVVDSDGSPNAIFTLA